MLPAIHSRKTRSSIEFSLAKLRNPYAHLGNRHKTTDMDLTEAWAQSNLQSNTQNPQYCTQLDSSTTEDTQAFSIVTAAKVSGSCKDLGIVHPSSTAREHPRTRNSARSAPS